MDIKYLKHNEISKLKWDRCISQSFNGIVYAYSWYLDIVSYQWEALVLGDYEAVMPLTQKAIYGIVKIAQPQYATQLGVFTSNRLDVDLVNAFLDALPKRFKKAKVNLNAFNKASHSKFKSKTGSIFELDLIEPYKKLYLKFSDAGKEAIKNSKVNKVNVMKSINLKEFLLLKKSSSDNPLTFDQLNTLRRIIPFCTNHNIGNTYGAYNSKNELVAGGFFMKSHQKVICLVAACSKEGLEVNADYSLFNHYLKENCGKNLTLDFGNPEINEIEKLSKDLGAQAVSFLKLKKHKSWWLF